MQAPLQTTTPTASSIQSSHHSTDQTPLLGGSEDTSRFSDSPDKCQTLLLFLVLLVVVIGMPAAVISYTRASIPRRPSWTPSVAKDGVECEDVVFESDDSEEETRLLVPRMV